MFHTSLFALLSGMFLLFAFSALRADLLVVAVPSALMALWLGDTSLRSGRAVVRRRRARRTGSERDEGT